jgi:homoserine kinase
LSHFHIRLPATSANLGPGFDAVALALELYLDLNADLADAYSIQATGRNIDVSTRLDRNLMLAVYEDTLRAAGKPAQPLAISLDNGIPIGVGCGSSAAARLAGIALANRFGELGWSGDRILQQACRLEGHPDNAAACWLGGFTVAAGAGEGMRADSIDPPLGWIAILVLPDAPLSTSAARAVLPASYTRADAVANIQNVALLTAAFHTGRADLLQLAMADRLHQPYRAQVCPLLPVLLPLAGKEGILGVALSGAGPAVLALVHAEDLERATSLIQHTLPRSSAAECIATPLGRSLPSLLPKITEV